MDLALISLIVLSLFFIGTGVVIALVSPMSFMAFDSGESCFAWLLVIWVFSYPLLVVLSQIAAWWMYWAGAGNPILVSLIPFVSPIALIVMFAITGRQEKS